MRRTLLWLGIGLLGVAAVSNCGDAFSVEDVVAAWETESINGQRLPGAVRIYATTDTFTVDVQWERWTFLDLGQCTETAQVDGNVSSIDAGDCAYVVDETAKRITITLFADVTLEGPVDGDRITLSYRIEPAGPLNTIVLRRV